MSEFTFGFIVKNAEQNEQHVREIINTTNVKELNKEWSVFITGNFDVPQSVLELSHKCPVLNFHNAEDHAWGFTIFHQGEAVSTIEISYELEDEIITGEIEKRHPEVDDYIEFIYIDPQGQAIYAEIQSELNGHEEYIERVKEQFSQLHTQSFELFNVSQDKIHELNQILTPEYLISLKAKHDLVEQFKNILELEEMSWIRPDRPENFHDEPNQF